MLARLMPLLTLTDAELAFGLHPLLDRASFAVRSGERFALLTAPDSDTYSAVSASRVAVVDRQGRALAALAQGRGNPGGGMGGNGTGPGQGQGQGAGASKSPPTSKFGLGPISSA